MSLDPLRVVTNPPRPGSSHSNRTVSRASQRSASRLSLRSIKQSHLTPLLEVLVKQVKNLNGDYDTDDIHGAVDLASKRIEQVKQAVVPSLAQIDAQIRGQIKKARIHSKGVLADVLHAKYVELKGTTMQYRDQHEYIKSFMLPSHLCFLLLLSSPPTNSTLLYADKILVGKDEAVPHSPPLTWELILKEEPFEGQHWQGAYGLPNGSVVGDWEEERKTDSSDSSFLDNIECDDISTNDTEQSPSITHSPVLKSHLGGIQYMDSRTVLETLLNSQYWQSDSRSTWRYASGDHPKFDIGNPSMLGPTLDCILLNGPTPLVPESAFIAEIDAVREVLIMLQGCRSCLFETEFVRDNYSVKILLDRRIPHLTKSSQKSIMNSFADFASVLNPLRLTVKDTLFHSLALGVQCRTLVAFTAAVEHQLHVFDTWCVGKEAQIVLGQQGECLSSNVISLLSLQRDIVTGMSGTFVALLDVFEAIGSKRDLSHQSMSTLILNTLSEAIRAHIMINDGKTSAALIDVWQESVEPLWSNLRRWLKDGIPIRAGFDGSHYNVEPDWDENEFFIRKNPFVDVASDANFWESGYVLSSRYIEHNPQCSSDGSLVNGNSLPFMMLHIAEDVLAAGKAVGLLRAMNMTYLVEDDWLRGWVDFKSLTASLPHEGFHKVLDDLISDTLLPSCQLAQSWLRRVLVEDCELWKHLQGLEDICLMTRGDAMSSFSETLFARMDARQPWNDYYFLNASFREVTKLGSRSWINASLVKLTHQGNKDQNINRTLRSIEGLAIEYAVPFPLNYLFSPESSAKYSSLFCFLLQIRRSKSVLDRILVRRLNNGILDYRSPDLRMFYTLRQRLSCTFLTFIMTNVIHVGLLEFHEALRSASSLDEMILIHRTHLERLLGRCLLQPSTAALHQAILSILDLSIHFNDCLSAFADDTSLDVSRHSLIMMRRRHRRKRRIGHTDVIGFVEALSFEDSDSDSDSESDDEDIDAGHTSRLLDSSFVSLAGEDFVGRLDRVSLDLDGLVRFVQRGVDNLASGGGDASATFGILAFCLEDWN